jgi:hypothetical protein
MSKAAPGFGRGPFHRVMRIDRRKLLRLGIAGTAWLATSAHTPYRQWTAYRKKHLLIGTCKTDEPTYPLGKHIAATLAEYLPESKARVSRAPDQMRLASLITTGQMQVILLSSGDVEALAAGAPPFDYFGPTPLTALFRFADHVLVTRPDFPDLHAWLIAGTLSDRKGDFDDAGPALAGALPVPVHPGALARAAGEPEPPGPPPIGEILPPVDHLH